MRESHIFRQARRAMTGAASGRSRGRRLAGYVSFTLSAGLTAALAAPALAGAWSPAAPPRSAPMPDQALPATTVSQAAGQVLTLVTGEQVRLIPAPGGRSVVSVLPAPKASSSLMRTFVDTFELNGDVYAVPGYALPYLGSRLDPRLFDVSYLQRAGYAGLTALPLSVSWQQAAHAAIPGLAAPATGRTTTGSVTTSSARAFGQALQASFLAVADRAEAAPGSGPLPVTGVLSEVRKISLGPVPGERAAGSGSAAQQISSPGAGPAPAPAVPLRSRAGRPGAKLYSLTVHALGRNGRPGFALIFIQDLDHFRDYYSVNAVTPGQPLAVSVPAGRYGIEAVIYHLWQDALPEGISFVTLPQVPVSHDDAVTLDARRAKPVTVKVPRPAATEIGVMSFTRISADGTGIQGFETGFGQGVSTLLPPLHLFAQPAAAPRTGSLDFADTWELVPPGTGLEGVDAAYTYSLDFASSHGVPATLSRVLSSKDLAAVRDRFADSVPGSGANSLAAPFHRWQTMTYALFPTFLGPFPVPAQRTDYFGGSAKTVWEQAAGPVPPSAPALVPATFGPYRTFHPGEHLSMTWGASPSVPAPEWQWRGLRAGSRSYNGFAKTWSYLCPVCRQGNVMSFNVPDSGDSDPTHTESMWGFGSGILHSTAGPPTDVVKFYRNGVLTQLAGTSGQVFPMLPGKAHYRIDWASTIPAAWTQLATGVHSVWTFTSRPARPEHLPSYELCSPDAASACSFVPLVFASYRFGASLQGQVHAPGTETFTVTGYHEAGLTGPAVTQAWAQVSFDDGKTWSPAATVTSLGGGRFRVTIAQPDPSTTSGYASIRVTLTDTAGDSLRQTIIRAYALTTVAAAGPAHGNK